MKANTINGPSGGWLMPLLKKVPFLSDLARSHGWHYLISWCHRISGVALGAGTLLMTWWLVAAASTGEAFAHAQWFMGGIIGHLLLFGWSVALIFHFCSGLRHLWMDTGRGFEPGEYDRSGWAVIVATGVLTVLVWAVALVVG